MKLLMTACALGASGLVLAKLPPLDDAAKAKAAETASRAAWQAKIDAYQLCKVQDRIAGQYRAKGGMVRTGANPSAGTANAPSAAPSAAPVAAAGASAGLAPSTAAAAAAINAAAPPTSGVPAAGAAPASSAVTPSNPPTQGATAAAPASPSGTPVANVAAAPAIPACTDPGPFAYNPPSQTPLETSGAHSPAGNAATPPSVRPESAQMAPAGPAAPQSKKP